MPSKRRRPVIEEIIEKPTLAPHHAPVHTHIHTGKHETHVEEVSPEPVFTQTAKEIASYDEPPMLEETPKPAFLSVSNAPKQELSAKEILENIEVKGSSKKSNMKLLFVVTVLTALIVGFIAGGVYVYVSGVSEAPIVTKTETPTPTPVPQTATPKPVIKLDSLSVNVLNGSGVIGAAGKVKTALEAGGFSVNGTANASNYNFKQTLIQTKSTISPEILTILKNSLSGYTVSVGENLPDSSKYDIIVTAGKE